MKKIKIIFIKKVFVIVSLINFYNISLSMENINENKDKKIEFEKTLSGEIFPVDQDYLNLKELIKEKPELQNNLIQNQILRAKEYKKFINNKRKNKIRKYI